MPAVANVWDLIARDGASPVFNRVAVAADRSAVATERATTAGVGFGKKMVAAFAGFAVADVLVHATKAAVDFQKAMLLIQTQAGASAREVKQMSTAVLGLSGRVATGPMDLATSLYHVESAGLRGAKALNVTKIAAEGAKVGNADLEQTTNALTSAVVSGIGGVKNMQQAMGVLNGIVGTGDMKLSDLNDALGTGLLAAARVFGVSIQEVGAALATFGDNNIRGADAATKLRMVMQDIAKPAAHADDYLGKINLTAAQLRAELTQHGLNAALELLHTHLVDGGLAGKKMGAFLEDAFTKKAGVGLAILETQLGRFERKLPEISAKGKQFGADWTATTKTASFAFDQIKAKVESFGISVGTRLLPYVTEAAKWLGTNLPKALSTVGQLIAPLARDVGGVLAMAWHGLATALGAAGSALAAVGKFLTDHGTVVKVATHAVEGLLAVWAGYRIFTLVEAAVIGLTTAFRNGVSSLTRFGTATRAAFTGSAAQAAVSSRIMQAEFASIEASALQVAAGEKAAASIAMEAMAEEVKATGTASKERIANIESIILALHAEEDAAWAAAAQASAAAQEAATATAVAGREAQVAWSSILGPIGLIAGALAAVGLGFLGSGEDAAKAAAQVQSYTDAIEQDSTALGKNTRAAVVNALQKEGALKQAHTLGINLADLTDAVIHQGGAYDTLRASLTKTMNAHTTYTSSVSRAGDVESTTYDRVGAAAKALLATIGAQSGELKTGAQNARDYASALRTTSGAATVSQATAKSLGSTLQDQVPAYTALKNVTIDLKTASQLLNGALSALEGTLNRAAAAVQWQQSLNDLTKTFKQNKDAIEGHSNAALADRAAFIADAQQIVQNAAAMKKHGASVQAVTGYLHSHIDALKAAAEKAGADKGEVDKLARSLHLVPKNIRSQINVDITAAMQRVNTLEGAIKQLGQNMANADTVGSMSLTTSHATGGAIFGAGGPRQDRVRIDASPGEHMLTASDVAKVGGQGAVYRMRSAIQAGALKFAKGGAVSSLLDLIRRAGFRGRAADIMYGIVEAESGGSPTAHNYNPSTGDDSYGLAQLNLYGSLRAPRMAAWHISDPKQLYNPALNLRIAHQMYLARGGFGDWTTYTSGKYRQFMDGGYGATVHGGGAGSGGGGGGSKRSNALSVANTLLSTIGQRPSPQFQVASSGIGRIADDLRTAGERIANLAHLKPADRARFEAQFAKLVKLAQKQFDKLMLRIRGVDLAKFRDALKGTAADVKAAFAPMIKDLKAAGDGAKAIGRLRGHEEKLLNAIRDRNRLNARLVNLDNRMAALKSSVVGGVTGSFDVTSAGVNPVTGRVGGGSMLAQQTQALNRVKKFVHLSKVLERRKLVAPYLNSLLAQGPSVLPQLEALASMGDKQFAAFNANEREIQRLAEKAGAGLARHDLGAKREQTRDDRQAAEKIAVKQAGIIGDAIRDELKHLRFNGHALFLGLKKVEREMDRTGGAPGGRKP